MMDLIDIGINLTHDSFDPDRDTVISHAAAVGVRQLLVTGATVAHSRQAIALAQAHPRRLFATAGVHPHHALELDDAALDELKSLAAAPEVVAVGECGLDYFRNFSPPQAQRGAFARQLQLAAALGKPLFLHQRDAHEDFVAALRDFLPHAPGGVAHCFTAGAAQLEVYLELGLHIGITGWICDERRGQHLQPLVARIPADRLMLETDGPYLLPRDLAPKPASRRNEPRFLPHIATVVARLRGEDPLACAARCAANARRLFGLPALQS
ncbi:MAG: TatD family hydrolase [Steroidobacteraceae bacterium]